MKKLILSIVLGFMVFSSCYALYAPNINDGTWRPFRRGDEVCYKQIITSRKDRIFDKVTVQIGNAVSYKQYYKLQITPYINGTSLAVTINGESIISGYTKTYLTSLFGSYIKANLNGRKLKTVSLCVKNITNYNASVLTGLYVNAGGIYNTPIPPPKNK